MKTLGSFSAIISLFLLFLPLCFSGQTPDIRSAPLKGIKNMDVVVEDLTQAAAGIGLTRERIQSVTELKLRREGISVPSAFSFVLPYLYIRINVVGKAFSIDVSLKEDVTLKRDASITCGAATWSRNATGVSGDSPYIIQGLQEILDEFLNDYYKANPKK
jgi:hypothetical protein